MEEEKEWSRENRRRGEKMKGESRNREEEKKKEMDLKRRGL